MAKASAGEASAGAVVNCECTYTAAGVAVPEAPRANHMHAWPEWATNNNTKEQ